MMNKTSCVICLAMLISLPSAFGVTIPKESSVLGALKGGAVATGLVFVNGKYIEPPYVVRRWGCGIKINKYTVIGEAVTWADFVKTQSGAKVIKTEVPAAAPVATPEPAKPAAASTTEDLDTSLDDLFDDDPKPAKPSKPAQSTWKPKPVKAAPTVTYTLEGEFVKNDAAKALLKKVNEVRSEIDQKLRMGNFICFGDNYSRVSGDSATALQVLKKISQFQRESESPAEFAAKVRGAKMEYLPDGLCEDLFKNRVDYRKLHDRAMKWEKEKAVQQMLNNVSTPVL